MPQTVKTWDEVISSPEFHALSKEDQISAKEQYFLEVIAPQVPQQDLESARSEFLNDLNDVKSQVSLLSKGLESGSENQPKPRESSPASFPLSGFPGAVQTVMEEARGGRRSGDLDLVTQYAQPVSHLTASGITGGNPVAGVAGGTAGRALSELTQILRGDKPASYEGFAKEVGKGALESTAGEAGARVLGFLVKFPALRSAIGALVGGSVGSQAGKSLPVPDDQPNLKGALETGGKVSGAIAGGVLGAMQPQKVVQLGMRAFGGLSKFASERIMKRGADIVLSEEKLDPGYFSSLAKQAVEAFDVIKKDAYQRFKFVADKVKYNPKLKIDVSTITDDLEKELLNRGVLNKVKGGVELAQQTAINSTNELKTLLSIYDTLKGFPSEFAGSVGKFARKQISFKEASQLMDFIDDYIPRSAFQNVSESGPLIGAMKHLRGEVSNAMKDASPVLRQAFEDYAEFAETRRSILPMLRTDETAETAFRNFISSARDVKRQNMEKMLSMLPKGKELLENIYDASAAKELFNQTIKGIPGISKELTENVLRGAGQFSSFVRPAVETSKKAVKRASPAGLSALLGSVS